MLRGTWHESLRLHQLIVYLLCLNCARAFLSPTSGRAHGQVPAKALCLDYDRELLQFLSAYNFTQHTRSPLPELRVR